MRGQNTIKRTWNINGQELWAYNAIIETNPKMGYFGGPNKALANPCFKDQFGLICEGRKRTRREREGRAKKRRRGRGRRRGEEKGGIKSKKVWKLNSCMDSMRLSMNFHALMLNCLSPNLGF